MSSFVVTHESLPGRDANQFISGKAAPAADGLTAGQFSNQSYQGCVQELLSKWLTGQQGDHFSEHSVWENAALLLAHFTHLV